MLLGCGSKATKQGAKNLQRSVNHRSSQVADFVIRPFPLPPLSLVLSPKNNQRTQQNSESRTPKKAKKKNLQNTKTQNSTPQKKKTKEKKKKRVAPCPGSRRSLFLSVSSQRSLRLRELHSGGHEDFACRHPDTSSTAASLAAGFSFIVGWEVSGGGWIVLKVVFVWRFEASNFEWSLKVANQPISSPKPPRCLRFESPSSPKHQTLQRDPLSSASPRTRDHLQKRLWHIVDRHDRLTGEGIQISLLQGIFDETPREKGHHLSGSFKARSKKTSIQLGMRKKKKKKKNWFLSENPTIPRSFSGNSRPLQSFLLRWNWVRDPLAPVKVVELPTTQGIVVVGCACIDRPSIVGGQENQGVFLGCPPQKKWSQTRGPLDRNPHSPSTRSKNDSPKKTTQENDAQIQVSYWSRSFIASMRSPITQSTYLASLPLRLAWLSTQGLSIEVCLRSVLVEVLTFWG